MLLWGGFKKRLLVLIILYNYWRPETVWPVVKGQKSCTESPLVVRVRQGSGKVTVLKVYGLCWDDKDFWKGKPNLRTQFVGVRVIMGLKATNSVPEATGSSRLDSSPARKRIKKRNFSRLKYPYIQRGHTWLSPTCVCAFLIWGNFLKLYVKCTVDIKVFTGIIAEERCDLSSQHLSLLQWCLTEKVLMPQRNHSLPCE